MSVNVLLAYNFLDQQIWKPDPYVYYSSFVSTVDTVTGHSEWLSKDPSGFVWWKEQKVADTSSCSELYHLTNVTPMFPGGHSLPL